MKKDNNVRSLWRNSLLVWMLLLVAGCNTTHIQSVYRAKGFDVAALDAGGLGIVAVTRADVLDYYAAEPIAFLVEEQVHECWPRVKTVSLKDVEQLLGKEPYHQLRDIFHGDGVMPTDQFSRLQPLEATVRYALFVDVREDKDDRYYSESTSETKDTTTDPETGKVITETTWTDYEASWTTSRKLKVQFIIYDLKNQKAVWKILIEGEKRNDNTRYSPVGFPRVSLPDTPTPADVMIKMAKRMIRQLPKTDKSGPMP